MMNRIVMLWILLIGGVGLVALGAIAIGRSSRRQRRIHRHRGCRPRQDGQVGSLGKMNNPGQCCVAAKRFIVVEKLADRFLDKFQTALASLEFANTSFATATKQTKHNQKKDTVIKMKNKLSSAIITVTQSKWIRPAVMTLALLVAVLGVTGCQPHH